VLLPFLKPSRHALGFTEIPLLRTSRLEVWLHRYTGPGLLEDVHSHRYAFASVVLAGVLAESRYLMVPGAGADVFRPVLAPREPCVLASGPVGSCSLVRRFTKARRAPHLYWIRPWEFHRVEAVRTPAVTLFCKWYRGGACADETHYVVRERS
jgi:hypothetical protein